VARALRTASGRAFAPHSDACQCSTRAELRPLILPVPGRRGVSAAHQGLGSVGSVATVLRACARGRRPIARARGPASAGPLLILYSFS